VALDMLGERYATAAIPGLLATIRVPAVEPWLFLIVGTASMILMSRPEARDDATLASLRQLLDKAPETAREQIARLVADLNDDAGYAALLARASDPAIEKAAMFAITSRRDANARDLMRARLPVTPFRGSVLHALAATGDVEPAIEELRRRGPDAWKLFTAVGAFGGLRGRRVIVEVLEDNRADQELRRWALNWISEQKDDAWARKLYDVWAPRLNYDEWAPR
jgi:hypothetical protein